MATQDVSVIDGWTVAALVKAYTALHKVLYMYGKNKIHNIVHSFVRYCGQRSSLLWTPALRPCNGPMRLPRERRGIGRCVCDVYVMCGVEGLSKSEQLVGYFYSEPPPDVAYCLALP